MPLNPTKCTRSVSVSGSISNNAGPMSSYSLTNGSTALSGAFNGALKYSVSCPTPMVVSVSSEADQQSTITPTGLDLSGVAYAENTFNQGYPVTMLAASGASVFDVTFALTSPAQAKIALDYTVAMGHGQQPIPPEFSLKDANHVEILGLKDLTASRSGWTYNNTRSLPQGTYQLTLNAIARVSGDPLGDSVRVTFKFSFSTV